MAFRIDPRPDATEEDIAIIGSLREAIDNRAKLNQLIDLRAYRPGRDQWNQGAFLLDRCRSPLLERLLATLVASDVSLILALSVPLRINLNSR